VYVGVANEEAAMNTTDMYSREKANRANLEEMRRAMQGDSLLRRAAQEDGPEVAAAHRRVLVAWAVAALIAVLVVAIVVSASNAGEAAMLARLAL
jgi:hypothetical protein